jgi:hypothetical protein
MSDRDPLTSEIRDLLWSTIELPLPELSPVVAKLAALAPEEYVEARVDTMCRGLPRLSAICRYLISTRGELAASLEATRVSRPLAVFTAQMRDCPTVGLSDAERAQWSLAVATLERVQYSIATFIKCYMHGGLRVPRNL